MSGRIEWARRRREAEQLRDEEIRDAEREYESAIRKIDAEESEAERTELANQVREAKLVFYGGEK